MNLLKQKRGFTLIEVIIVLAIGALIILVVLQAVGSARRAQRDNERKQEAARVAALLEEYASNNAGKYPPNASFATFVTAYTEANDPLRSYTDVAACPAGLTQDQKQVEYVPATTSFTLSVCLEAGTESQITQ